MEDFSEPLPDGVSWPKELPDYLLEDGVRMSSDVPSGVISVYWLCAWDNAYLEAADQGDLDAAAAALEKVDLFSKLPFYTQQTEDPDGEWLKAVELAKGGNSAALRDFYTGGCGYFAAENP
ncbi:hypothetical protein [Herbiconiux liangxiaofengii]|uniref:hypothetical protein n=1 Tax=Herbiconiux liangxiaofengii TaxID=3342795 RepID=UPI0035B78D05